MENAQVSVNNSSEVPAYTLLLACPDGFSGAQVRVDFGRIYERIPHPDNKLEESISEIWDRRIQENPSLYNGNKFRYGGHFLQTIETGSSQDSYVCLHLGLTDYRTFMGTNLNPVWEKFLVPSEDDSIRCQHMSSPLGNGAVVETADERVLVLQRSYNVGEFPGHFVFPGGHSEPEEIGISGHTYGEDLTAQGHLNDKVSQEMFDGIIREVIEETGIPASALNDPVLIGISRRKVNVRPTAFFFIRCKLESQEIQQLYSGGVTWHDIKNARLPSRRVCTVQVGHRSCQEFLTVQGSPMLVTESRLPALPMVYAFC